MAWPRPWRRVMVIMPDPGGPIGSGRSLVRASSPRCADWATTRSAVTRPDTCSTPIPPGRRANLGRLPDPSGPGELAHAAAASQRNLASSDVVAGPVRHRRPWPEAHAFVKFLAEAGQRWWQILPLGPPGAGNSPYQSFSSYAGNPLLISPELLVEDGWLTPGDWYDYPRAAVDSGRFRGRRRGQGHAASQGVRPVCDPITSTSRPSGPRRLTGSTTTPSSWR